MYSVVSIVRGRTWSLYNAQSLFVPSSSVPLCRGTSVGVQSNIRATHTRSYKQPKLKQPKQPQPEQPKQPKQPKQLEQLEQLKPKQPIQLTQLTQLTQLPPINDILGVDEKTLGGIKSLLNEMKQKFGIRKMPLMISRKNVFKQVISRESVVKEIYQRMYIRQFALLPMLFSEELTSKIIHPMRKSTLREICTLISLVASPGTGQSYLLELLGNHVYLDMCKDEGLKAMLSSSTVLYITFGVPTQFIPKETIDPHLLLVMRAVYSYYNIFVEFGEFCTLYAAKFQGILFPHIMHVLKDDKPMLVLVDESAQLEPHISTVTSKIYTLLDRYIDFNCVFTSLDAILFEQSLTSSKRIINWICLGLPSQALCHQLMDNPRKHTTEYQLINDCGNHLNTLSMIKQMVPERKDSRLHHEELTNITLKRLPSFSLENLPKSAVVAALLGHFVFLSDKVSNDKTYSHLVKIGAIVYAGSPYEQFIPQIAPLTLHRWISHIVSDDIAQCLKHLFIQLAELHSFVDKNKDNQGNTGFEMFRATWLQLYMHLLDGQSLTLQNLFKLQNRPISNLKIVIQELSHLQAPLFTKKTKALSFDPFEHILQFPHPNEGIDGCSAHMIEGSRTEAVLLAYQDKFSLTNSKTTLKFNHMQHSCTVLNNMVDILNSGNYSWAKGIKFTGVLVVFFQDIPKFKKSLPPNVIIVDQEAMGRMLPPALNVYH